jgi:hypothetical protein
MYKRIIHKTSKKYKKEWKGFPDFLGYEDTDWSIRKAKELLKVALKLDNYRMVFNPI